MNKVGETYDEVMLSRGMDLAADAIPALGLMTIGAIGPSLLSGAAVHAISGMDRAGKNFHMAGQIQGAGNIAKRLDVEVPGTLEKFREVSRPLFAAERKQMEVLDDPKLLHWYQDFASVPPEWMDALQDILDKRHVERPGGTVSGKTFEQFLDETMALSSEATEKLNAGRAKHGEEQVDEMGPLHPSSYSSMGTSNLLTRQFSELGTGIANTKTLMSGSNAKGFENTDVLKADLEDAYAHHSNRDAEGFYVPLNDFRYLARRNKAGELILPVEIKGSKVYLLEDGKPVKSPGEFDRWVKDETQRFVEDKSSFSNVDDLAAGSADGYHRQFPMLKNAHKATFQDLAGEILSRRNEAAALEAHPVGFEKKVEELRQMVTGQRKDAELLKSYLGEEGDAKASTLIGRAYQQRGRLPSGTPNQITRYLQAWMPFAYKMQLGINPTAAAAQQGQTLAQTAAFQFGDKGWTGRALKQYGKTYGKHFASLATPGGRSELRMGVNKHADPMGLTAPMELGTAMIERTIKSDAEAILGNALRNGNAEFLEAAYTPEEIAHLDGLMRADGTVDLSDPADRELAQTVVARYLEGHNGLDLATSKPAFMQSNGAKVLGMYASTPAVISKAVSDLYRPGGLFHTGNRLQDARGRAHVAAALSGQVLAATAIRSHAAGKAMALLSAGALIPALSAGWAAAKGHESGGELGNRQQLELLAAAANRVAKAGEGDVARAADDFARLFVINLAGSLPLKVTDAASNIGELAGSIDRRAMNYNAGKTMVDEGLMSKLESLGAITPVVSAPVGIAKKFGQAFDAGRQPVDGRWISMLMRDKSPFPFVRENSLLLPSLVPDVPTGVKETPGFGGVQTYKLKIRGGN